MSITPGTTAHAALIALRRAGRELPTQTLARHVGANPRRLVRHLYPALRAGLLVRRVDGCRAMWSIGYELTPAPRVRVLEPLSPLAVPSVFAWAQLFLEAA